MCSMATITHEEFKTACLEFLKLAEELRDTWKLRNDIPDKDAVCIHKIQYGEESKGKTDCDVRSQYEEEKEEQDDEDKEAEPEDPSIMVQTHMAKFFITFDYHIVYSLSHSVPVLYFNAWHSSGQLLSLDEVWERVDATHREQIISNKWGTLTQVEHPLLGRPYFQLHPCNTAKLMGQVIPQSASSHSPATLRTYLVSWLSMFGPPVGLELPLCYFAEQDDPLREENNSKSGRDCVT